MKNQAQDPRVYDVLDEVRWERFAQDQKWGQQNHANVDTVLINREGGCSAHRMAEHYEIPSAPRAKFLCQNAGRTTGDTYAHILIEEVAEAIEAATWHDTALKLGKEPDGGLKAELIQIAAVAVAWVEKLDREGAA